MKCNETTNMHHAQFLITLNLVHKQTRTQLGTTGGAKTFLRGVQIF